MANSERTTAISRALETLLFICQDTDWSIRYAAVVGLQTLAKIPEVKSPILSKFQEMLTNDLEKAVRARVLMAGN
jgi:phycocyanobilin lyase subunit beta